MECVPTAVQLSAAVQDTSVRSLWPFAKLGVGWIDQVVPFHRYAPGPTAVHALPDVHDTPVRLWPGVFVGIDQLSPSHCSASGPTVVPAASTSSPTAVQVKAAVQATSSSSLSLTPAGLGVGWIDHPAATAGTGAAPPTATVITPAASAMASR
jgi:hypothetical protein